MLDRVLSQFRLLIILHFPYSKYLPWMPLHELAMKSRNDDNVTDKNNNSVYQPKSTSKPFTNYSKREFSEPPIETSTRIFSPEINTSNKRRLTVASIEDEQKRLVTSSLSQKYDLGGLVKSFPSVVSYVKHFFHMRVNVREGKIFSLRFSTSCRKTKK